MKRSASYLFTLLFAALAFFATAQSVDNVVVTPNPAYSNTPVTVTMQGQLFSSCDYLNGVSTSWSGATLNVYMDFNNTGGMCAWYVFNYEYPLSVGTLAPNNYTVKVWNADYNTLLFTKTFTVYSSGSGANGCNNPVLLSCGNTYSGNNANGGNNYTAYLYNGVTQYDYTGPEMIHRFTINSSGTVTLTLSGLSADLDLFLLNACNPSNVIALSGKSGSQSEYISVGLSAGTYYVIVDGWSGSVSNYNLSLQCPAGEGQNSCASPYVLQCGGVYQYNNSVGTNNYSIWYFNGTPHSGMTGKETIHRITLNNYTNLTLSMSGLSDDLDIYLFSACNNTSGIAFSENPYSQNETIKVDNLAPGTYYIIVDGYNNASSNYTLTVQCSTASSCQAPALSQLYVSNLTPTSVQLNCSLTGVQAYYWQYRPLNTGGNWIPWGQTTVPYIAVNGLIPNTTYEFQVQVRCQNNFISNWSASQTFTTLGGGVNNCTYPALLTCGSTFKYNNSLGSNHYATYKIGNGYLYGYSGPDVIHKFTINTTTNVTLNLFELSANLGLIVLNACNPNNGIAFSDNTGTLGEIISLPNLPAGTYYVIVDSKASYTYSNYSLSLSCNTGIAPPSNDEPCSASSIPVYGTCSYTTLTNVNATPTLNPSAAPITCSTTGMYDIWVRFVTPSTGSFSVSTQAGSLTDAVMAAYVGTNNSCTALTYFYCTDNYNSNLMPQVTFINGTPGQVIWLRFWGKNGATGSFTICAQIGNGSQGFAGESDELTVSIPVLEDQVIDFREDVRNEPVMDEPAMQVETLHIYPVPASDRVTIAGRAPQSTAEVALRIFDMNGGLVREQAGLNTEAGEFITAFDISDLPKGAYIVKVQAGDQMMNGRFLKVE